jgi:hypothetical protein
MTIDQAHIEFEVTLDKRYTSQAPEMPPEVIDYFLNEASVRFVKNRYSPNNVYQVGFEELQKRTEDLKALVKTEDVAIGTVSYEDANYGRVNLTGLANPYWFYLRSRILCSKENCADKWCNKPTLTQQDDLGTVLDDPFNKPVFGVPVMYFEDGDIFVVSDDTFTTPSMKLTYLKKPNEVNVGTYGQPAVEFDLSEHTHKEIVQMAADIAIENIESQRIQTIKQQLQTIE